MAQYFTNFSEYPSDQHPADWTQRRDLALQWRVRTDPDATGGKILEIPAKSANIQSVLTWDRLDSDPDRANAEILIRFRYWSTTASLYAWVRHAQDSPVSGYRLGDSYTTTTIGIIGKYVNGSYSNVYIAGGGAVNEQGRWAYIRAQAENNVLRVRVWKDGDPEPEVWRGVGTDNSLSAAGPLGVMSFNTGAVDIDFVGIGTGGDPAPMEPVDPGGDHYEDAISLSLSSGFGALGSADALGSVGFGLEHSALAGASAASGDALSLGMASGLSGASLASVSDAAGLSFAAGLSSGGLAQALSSLAFGLGIGLTYSDGSTQQYDDAMALGLSVGLVSAAVSEAQDAIGLDFEATVSVAGLATALATVRLGLSADVLATSTANVLDAVQIGAAIGQAVAAAVGEMMTPDGRVFSAGADRREFLVRADSRVISVSLDIRRFDA